MVDKTKRAFSSFPALPTMYSSFPSCAKRPGGGMVILDPSGTQVLLIQDDRHQKWSFPKGRCEPEDRDLVATAIRETAEETGFLPNVHYRITTKKRTCANTTCVLALALTTDLPFTSCPEQHVQRVEWVPLEDLSRRDLNLPLRLWAQKEHWVAA